MQPSSPYSGCRDAKTSLIARRREAGSRRSSGATVMFLGTFDRSAVLLSSAVSERLHMHELATSMFAAVEVT